MPDEGTPELEAEPQPATPPAAQNTPAPHGLVRRPVIHPAPLWTWSLVWRRDEDSAVRAVIDALTRDSADVRLDDETAWLPAADPYRPH